MPMAAHNRLRSVIPGKTDANRGSSVCAPTAKRERKKKKKKKISPVQTILRTQGLLGRGGVAHLGTQARWPAQQRTRDKEGKVCDHRCHGDDLEHENPGANAPCSQRHGAPVQIGKLKGVRTNLLRKNNAKRPNRGNGCDRVVGNKAANRPDLGQLSNPRQATPLPQRC